MGISRSSRHKRSASGAQRPHYRKKRRFELARPPAMTKLGAKRVHKVRTRGGNLKLRGLRLDTGNFAWTSEHIMRKARIIGVVYNSSNNELVRTNTLVKSCVVQIDAHPFRQWYEAHYATPVTKKVSKAAAAEGEQKEKKPAEKARVKLHEQRQKGQQSPARALKSITDLKHYEDAAIEGVLETQFGAGRLYAIISSRPGQSGRADGYILEGKELEFYLKRIRSSKKHQA